MTATTRLFLLATAAALLGVCLGAPARAERMQAMDDYQAHYSLVPTTLLNATVVADYGVQRGRDRALLTISVLDKAGQPVRVRISGTVKDLLGQERELALREVVEGQAVYYLAEVRHGSEEVLRFAIGITTPNDRAHQLEFQQKLYWGEQ